jgi:hypothetical protein
MLVASGSTASKIDFGTPPASSMIDCCLDKLSGSDLTSAYQVGLVNGVEQSQIGIARHLSRWAPVGSHLLEREKVAGGREVRTRAMPSSALPVLC